MTTYTKNFRFPIPDFDTSPWHADLITWINELDTLMLTAVGGSITPWVNAHTYTVGALVIDTTDGTIWLAATAHTSVAGPTTFASDRATHPTYWNQVITGLVSKGAWTHDTAYRTFDFVYDTAQGIIALCKAPHTSNHAGTIRDDAANWNFLFDGSLVGGTAIAVTFTPTGSISSGNVQAAIAELDSELSARVLALLDATSVSYSHAASTLVAVTVQDAVDELDAHRVTDEVAITANTANLATLISSPGIGSMMSALNPVVNSKMEVSQEIGTTLITLVNNTPRYTIDQWECGYNHAAATAVVKIQQVAPSGAPSFGATIQSALQMQATTAITAPAAGDFAFIIQPIEGYRVSKFGFGSATVGQSITVGFWVYATIAGTAVVSIRNSALNRSYVKTFTIVAPTTWEYKTVTVPADVTGTWLMTNGIGMLLSFSFCPASTFAQADATWGAGSKFCVTGQTNFFATNNNLVQLTGVSGTPGTRVPTAGESVNLHASLDNALDECQRYWEKSYEYGVVPGTVTTLGMTQIYLVSAANISQMAGQVSYRKRKRAAATIASYSTNTGTVARAFDANVPGDVLSNVGGGGESAFFNAPSATVPGLSINLQFQWTASARM